MAVAGFWNGSSAGAPRFESTAGPSDTPSLMVSLDGSRPRVTDDSFAIRRQSLVQKSVSLPAAVHGVPPEFNVHTIVARSRLELAGGVVLETGDRSGKAALVGFTGGSATGRETAVEYALGGVRLLTGRGNSDAVPVGRWPTGTKVNEEAFVRHRSEPGRLIANLDVLFERGLVRLVLSLADGAATNVDGARVSIVRLIRRPTGCTVLLRRSYVESLLSVARYRQFIYALRNSTRREAIASDAGMIHQDGFGIGVIPIPSLHVGGRAFVNEQYQLQFPGRSAPDTSPVDLDPAWLQGAELRSSKWCLRVTSAERLRLSAFV